ncbi:MAG: alpha/beta hydrolase [Candidatus Babeliales bacterium]
MIERGQIKINKLVVITYLYLFFYSYMIASENNNVLQKKEERSEVGIYEYLQKQKKYLKNGLLEYITFEVQQSEDNKGKKIQRSGILYLNPKAHATVLVCHGFMCDKFDVGFIRQTMFTDFNVLIFDFRAHGEHVNDEHCCTFGRDEALDVIGAVNYLKSRNDLKKLPCIAYGFSMGAVAAIQAQAADPTLFAAMILDCPYDKSSNVIKRSIENLKFNLFGYTFEMPGRYLLEKFAFNPYVQSFLKALLKTVAQMDATATNTYIHPLNPVDSIKKVSIPCLLIHCHSDEKVPVQSAFALYENMKGYKRLWITQGRRHFDSIFYNPEKYMYKVNTFIHSVLNGSINQKIHQKVHYDVVV